MAPLLDDERLAGSGTPEMQRHSYYTTKERLERARSYKDELKLKSLNHFMDVALDFFFEAIEERKAAQAQKKGSKK